MVDCDVVGCCWIELPKGKYQVRQEKTPGDMNSGKPSMVSPPVTFLLLLLCRTVALTSLI